MELEKDLNRLEEISKILENGASLDESIKLYEEGIQISKRCMETLEKAKGKISLIQNGEEIESGEGE